MKHNKEKKEIRKKMLVKLLLFFIIVLSFLILDQITKYGVTSAFKVGDTSKGSFMRFGNVHNYSTTFLNAFKINVHRYVIIFVNFLLLLLFASISITTKYKWISISAGIVGAGILGNLFDRMIHGYVIDWLNLPWANNGYFNFADTYVMIGAILLAINTISIVWKK